MSLTACNQESVNIFNYVFGTNHSVAQADELCVQVFGEGSDGEKGVCEQEFGRLVVSEISKGDLYLAITQASRRHAVSAIGMHALAGCESGYGRALRNPSGATGHFQHMSRYWNGRVAQYNERFEPDISGDIMNPVSQSEITAMMIADGQISAWSCSPCYTNPYQRKCQANTWRHLVEG